MRSAAHAVRPDAIIGLRLSCDELAPWAASHMDIDGFDISGIQKKKHGALKEAGAENLKRIHSFGSGKTPARILAFMESKTVWHSVGV